jgi:hypothetical protein
LIRAPGSACLKRSSGGARVRAGDDPAVLLGHRDAIARLEARAPLANARLHPLEVLAQAVERERRLLELERASKVVARLDRLDVGMTGVEEHEPVDAVPPDDDRPARGVSPDARYCPIGCQTVFSSR